MSSSLLPDDRAQIGDRSGGHIPAKRKRRKPHFVAQPVIAVRTFSK
jgi:hypothetical protein